MQLYLRPFYNILRQQNNFEWTTEHRTRFEDIKFQTQFQIQTNHSMQCAMLQILASAQHYYNHIVEQTTNKLNLISANSRLSIQAELRLSTLMRECTAIIYTLTEYEFLILGSKHPTVFFTDHKPIIFLFTQNRILMIEFIDFN